MSKKFVITLAVIVFIILFIVLLVNVYVKVQEVKYTELCEYVDSNGQQHSFELTWDGCNYVQCTEVAVTSPERACSKWKRAVNYWNK